MDPPRPSKIAPGGSPGGPPHRSLILAPFWLHFGGHFGSILGPPGPQKTWFSCGGCVIFRKNEGFKKKHPKIKPGYHGTGSARGERAYKHCKQGESSESSKNSQRPRGRITKRSKGESGEGRPRLETASAYYPLQPCSGATRPRRRFELGASRSHRVALKSLGNPLQIAPGSLPGPPGAHFGPPGAHFDPPGGHLGPPGAHVPGGHVGPPGALLGAPGALLGSLWGASWTLQDPPKSLPEALPEAPRTGA